MAESTNTSRVVPTERTTLSDAVYEFGDFRLDPGRGLIRNGELIHLPPKELELLNLLLRAEGAIVSNEEIEAKLWPRQIISHASVVRCVYSLRQLLGGSSGDYITTEPKRGYRLTRPPIQVPPRRSTMSVNARAYFEEGLREANRSQDASHDRALGLFDRAHALDAESPEPPMAMAECYVNQMNRGVLPPRVASRKAQEACDIALALEPQLARALALKGWFRGVVDSKPDALTMVERALDLAPTDPQILTFHAFLLRNLGRHGEAVAAARKAAELNPFMLLQIRTWTLFCAGLHDEALASAREAVGRRPYMDVTNAFLAVLAAWTGNHDEALAAGQSAAIISNRNPTLLCGLGYALARAGDHEAAASLAEEIAASLHPRAMRAHLSAIYVELGDQDSATACLEEGKSDGCPFFQSALYDPRLAALMEDEGVRALFD